MNLSLNWAHVHLLLNHFPIVGVILGVLLLAYALFKHSEDLKRASYWLFVLMALLSIAVYISGTQAAGVVINLPGVTEAYIHEHREIADWSFISLEVLGAMGFIGLLFSYRRKISPTWFASTTLLVTILAAVLVSWAGLQGGMIRHTEVRGDLPFLVPDENEAGGHSHGAESEHQEGNTSPGSTSGASDNSDMNSEQGHSESESGHSHE